MVFHEPFDEWSNYEKQIMRNKENILSYFVRLPCDNYFIISTKKVFGLVQ